MRWWLLSALVLAAIVEGLVLANWPILDAKIPLTWLALYLVMSKEWVGWRQSLAMAAISGYLLDVLAAPAPGAVLVPILAAWAISAYVLTKYKYSRDAKIAGFISGTFIVLAGSFAVPGPYLPGLGGAIWAAAAFLLISLASYFCLDVVVKFWLRRA